MMIVTGRGNKRTAFEMPCSHIVKRSPREQQVQALNLVCSTLNITSKEKKNG